MKTCHKTWRMFNFNKCLFSGAWSSREGKEHLWVGKMKQDKAETEHGGPDILTTTRPSVCQCLDPSPGAGKACGAGDKGLAPASVQLEQRTWVRPWDLEWTLPQGKGRGVWISAHWPREILIQRSVWGVGGRWFDIQWRFCLKKGNDGRKEVERASLDRILGAGIEYRREGG